MNREKLKILFLTPYFVPDYAASSPLYEAMAEDLGQIGHKVVILTGMPYYGKDRIWDEYRGKFWVRENRAGYEVIRVYAPAAPRTNVPSRVLSWGVFNILSSAVGLRLDKPDVLFTTNPFTMAGLPLHLLTRLRGIPAVYSVEDVYPDVVVRQGILQASLLVALVDSLERSCYQRSTYLRVLSEGMRQTLIAKGIPPQKIVVLPNFADSEFVRPLPRANCFRKQLGLSDEFIVLYAGNLGLSHALDTTLHAAQLLRQHTDIVFLLVGEGSAKTALTKQAKGMGLPNVRFLPFQLRDEVPWMLAAADVSLVTLNGSLGHESIPSKVYWILASGRPLLACVGGQGEISNLLSQSDCGVRVDPASADALADAILGLRANPQLREEMGRRGRDFVVRNYSRQVISRRLEGILRNAAAAPADA